MKTSGIRKQYKKRQLTKGQQKIAKAAPPYNKITGADFRALKKRKKR
tara:strand:+ start:105 stop:245 length:141 start_codon:yes stop_codon:yes gene_type:complete